MKQNVPFYVKFPIVQLKKKFIVFGIVIKLLGLVIRCPLRYKPKQIVKVYKSDVSQEEYTIKKM